MQQLIGHESRELTFQFSEATGDLDKSIFRELWWQKPDLRGFKRQMGEKELEIAAVDNFQARQLFHSKDRKGCSVLAGKGCGQGRIFVILRLKNLENVHTHADGNDAVKRKQMMPKQEGRMAETRSLSGERGWDPVHSW